MSKLIIKINSLELLEEVIKKDIGGVILNIDKLSINNSFYVNIDFIKNYDFKGKEVFLNINKFMHNDDISYLRSVLNEIKDMDVKILFYDMSVLKISKELGIEDKLVIYQEHLNASSLSNKYYYDEGIKCSYITSDITKDELLEISKNSLSKIMFTVYGYNPIFYSRRYLVSNYLKYINEDKGNNYKIISDMGMEYPISEEEYGTGIYTDKIVNLINYLDILKNIDYIVMDSNMINKDEFINVMDRFIKKDKMEDTYIGFFETKTIYKVK